MTDGPFAHSDSSSSDALPEAQSPEGGDVRDKLRREYMTDLSFDLATGEGAYREWENDRLTVDIRVGRKEDA